jgi:hypothetical protein
MPVITGRSSSTPADADVAALRKALTETQTALTKAKKILTRIETATKKDNP